MKMKQKGVKRLIFGLILAAISVFCLVIWALWEHPDWFGGDSLYKPLSDCPLPAPAVPADAGWSLVVPDSTWDGWITEASNQTLDAVAVDSKGQVYVAGDFSQIGGVQTGGIARWNPQTGKWADLAGGLLSRSETLYNLHLLVDAQDRVYVSGTFSLAGGRIANGIALWDGQAWSALDSGVMDGEVNGMALDGRGGLYVAGSFTRVGDLQSPGIAHWNGQGWENLGGLADRLAEQTENQPVTVTMIAYDAVRRILYASGTYNPLSAQPFIASWREDNFSLSMFLRSKFSYANQLAVAPNGDLYAGGSGNLVAGSEGIGRYARGRWGGLRGGLTRMGGSKLEQSQHGTTNVPNMGISSLVVDRAGQVYIAGQFTAVDDLCMHGVALWNGVEWKPLGSGLLEGASFGPRLVRSLAFDPQGNLVVAGGFQSAGGKPIRYLARWKP
jgi:hypothetical protein